MSALIGFHLAEFVDEYGGDIERAVMAYAKEVGWYLRTDGHTDYITFGFDNAKTRAGVFKPSRNSISLSRLYVAHATIDSIENTVLHEFAHACDYHERGESDHGANWRRWCARLGMKRIERCADSDEVTDMPQGKYAAYCPECDEIVAYRWRLTAAMRRSAMHPTCRTRIEWRDVEVAA